MLVCFHLLLWLFHPQIILLADGQVAAWNGRTGCGIHPFREIAVSLRPAIVKTDREQMTLIPGWCSDIPKRKRNLRGRQVPTVARAQPFIISNAESRKCTSLCHTAGMVKLAHTRFGRSHLPYPQNASVPERSKGRVSKSRGPEPPQVQILSLAHNDMTEEKQSKPEIRCIFSRTRPRSPTAVPIRIIIEDSDTPICAMAGNPFKCNGSVDEQARCPFWPKNKE